MTTKAKVLFGLAVTVALLIIGNGPADAHGLPGRASFGDVEGPSVPGTAEIDTAAHVLFADGFESGDTSARTEQ